MATTLELIENMPKGKTLNKRADNALIVVRHSDGGSGYHVMGSWLVPEKDDEDPESITCGCPLQFKSHAHIEADGLDAATAEKYYSELKANFPHQLNRAAFAKVRRIGG